MCQAGRCVINYPLLSDCKFSLRAFLFETRFKLSTTEVRKYRLAGGGGGRGGNIIITTLAKSASQYDAAFFVAPLSFVYDILLWRIKIPLMIC